MKYCVLTLFDYAHVPPLPLQSIVIGNDIKFYTFWLPGTGIKVNQIWKSIKEFSQIFNHIVHVNDFKTHVRAFNLDRHVDYDVYDLVLPPLKLIPKSEAQGKKFLATLAAEISSQEPLLWQRLLANASVVYCHLEDLGVRCGFKHVPIHYSLETFSGRSKTLGERHNSFNLQGTSDEFDVRSIYDANQILLHFDWITADIRMMAEMSRDPDMLGSYRDSDPYTIMVERLGGKYTRDVCKTQFLKSIYSLNIDSPILDVYPTFKKWMQERIGRMRKDGFLESLLGRRFFLSKDNELSVFNSQFQGSVVHAMQAVLTKIFSRYRNNILAEVHDSIVLSCPESCVKSIITDVAEIMYDPLFGYIEPSPHMPVRVSIGTEWKRWREYQIYR